MHTMNKLGWGGGDRLGNMVRDGLAKMSPSEDALGQALGSGWQNAWRANGWQAFVPGRGLGTFSTLKLRLLVIIVLQ